jgi:branched-chain amino acid transport system permease protein
MITILWSGLTLGAEYSLIALVYNVVWIGAGVFNFAQAQVVMVAAFASYEGADRFHLDVVLTLGMSVAIALIVCLLIERLAIRPLKQGGETSNELVTTVGAAVIIDGFALLAYNTYAYSPTTLPLGSPVTIFGGHLNSSTLYILGTAVVGSVFVALILGRTTIGLAWRASGEDSMAAQLRGVNTRRVGLAAFVLAGVLSGLIGVIISVQTSAVYNLGDVFAVKAFVALAFGGFGSRWGPLVGGMTIGVVEAFTSRYLGTSYADLTEFAILVVVLLVRPQGLLGLRRQRQV